MKARTHHNPNPSSNAKMIVRSLSRDPIPPSCSHQSPSGIQSIAFGIINQANAMRTTEHSLFPTLCTQIRSRGMIQGIKMRQTCQTERSQNGIIKEPNQSAHLTRDIIKRRE
eukprot:443825_1